MRIRRLNGIGKRLGAVALAVTLLPVPLAYAQPTTSTPDPVAPPAQNTPRRPATGGSEVTVDLDYETEEFRRRLAEQQARLDEFMAQLDALDAELEFATEEYNAALERLDETKRLVESVKGDIEKTQSAYDLQFEILTGRVTAIYREGRFGAIEVLLGAKSVSDFVARVKFLNTIGMRDSDIVASLKGQQELLESQMESLETAEGDAEVLEFELKARQIEIMLRIQERQDMLTQAQGDLVELLEGEAARRRNEEASLLAEILSGASDKGIVVLPNSPVETALAYHGIPYLWGGKTPAGFDCSGLMRYVFAQHGVSLPHYSGHQFLVGEKISPVALQPGDAVFFGSPIRHVGMYMGGGYYIHAPRTGDFVKISKLADRRDYAGARRYAWVPRQGTPTSAVTNVNALMGNGLPEQTIISR